MCASDLSARNAWTSSCSFRFSLTVLFRTKIVFPVHSPSTFTHDPSSQVSCLLLYHPSQNAISMILVSDSLSFSIGQSSIMSGLNNAVLNTGWLLLLKGLWRNGSASDSRSEGWGPHFIPKSRRKPKTGLCSDLKKASAGRVDARPMPDQQPVCKP